MFTSAPVFATVYNWVNEFKCGTSTCDAPRSGRSIEAATPKIINKVHDIVLIDRRVKVASLLRLQAYHMAQWFQFFTNNWVWKSYRQDGCRVFSLWIISATVWRFQNNVWRCNFNVLQINFCVDLLLWKHGFITSHLRRRNSQNNGLHQLRRRWKP